MAANDYWFFHQPGLTLYAKVNPVPGGAWTSNIVSVTENGQVDGEYGCRLNASPTYDYSNNSLLIFRRTGPLPTSGDQIVGTIQPQAKTVVVSPDTKAEIADAVWQYTTDPPGRTLTTAVISENTPSRTLHITRNDSYDGTSNDLLSIPVDKNYQAGWSGTFSVTHRMSGESLISGINVTVASASELTIALTTSDTALAELTQDIEYGPHPYDIEMASSGSVDTLKGVIVITKDVTT